MQNAVIEVRGFRKTYGDFVAVDDMNFDVRPGEIFGLLGPNGAGKTTTLESLEGLRAPDAGTLRVAGMDPAREPRKLCNLIGVHLQSAGLPESITPDEATERRLPAVLVSTNLALAGLLAIGYCGLGSLTVLSWWAIAVLGAVAGGLPLYTYHAWAVRRGLVAWSALLWSSDSATPVSSPRWRRLWLWILASFVILVAGMALATVGTSL